MTGGPFRVVWTLPPALESELRDAIAQARSDRLVPRLWDRDASLWTGADEARWLGWLDAPDTQRHAVPDLVRFAAETKAEGLTHVLLLGMGGSSLCPEVLAETFGARPGHPRLHVLDSTDPAQVRSLEERVDLARTLFVVSSKSGTTLEPNVFHAYFFDKARRALAAEPGRRFVAITDPGSKLQQQAERQAFRRVFPGTPSIGGRFSALSPFGLVPAALMGLDVGSFLERASVMVRACRPETDAAQNPGLLLGLALGVLARRGRDKLTLILSPGIRDLGAWIEQLVAESTGKSGRGIIPVDREQPGSPERYGEDRAFVYVRLSSAPDPAQDEAVEALERAGLAVVRMALPGPDDLGAEFFRWEFATAVAGSLLGVHPFDQPDVEASKIETRKLTSDYEAAGTLPPETPALEEDGIRLYTDAQNAVALESGAAGDRTLAGWLGAHLARLVPGDYVALLAYLPMNASNARALQAMRHSVRDLRGVATCLGFGPRFLHSTGQAYKGGPDSGVFLQITCDDAQDLPVPGQRYTFGVVKAAQARGDFQVLADRGRRALRVHLPADLDRGLATLAAAVDRALG
jgi:transaldolase/glucose-6-phosphate isomerase